MAIVGSTLILLPVTKGQMKSQRSIWIRLQRHLLGRVPDNLFCDVVVRLIHDLARLALQRADFAAQAIRGLLRS
jgi:hypothetical protein